MAEATQKLPAVEEAKALFTVAKDWSIVKWLAQKRHVRQVADRGTAAQDDLERRVKSTWSEDLRNAYAELTSASAEDDDPYAAAEREFLQAHARPIDDGTRAAAKRVKDADDEAYKTRMAAEETFDRAERRLSASIARRGAELAIAAYDLRYKAIAEATAAANTRHASA